MPRGSLISNLSPLLLPLLVTILTVELVLVSGFQATSGAGRPLLLQSSTTTSLRLSEDQSSDFERPATFLDEEDDDGINVVFMDDNFDNDDDEEDDDDDEAAKGKGRSRWENLNKSVKKRLVDKGQAKAIANKKKREPAADKKRRELVSYSTYIIWLLLFENGGRVTRLLLPMP